MSITKTREVFSLPNVHYAENYNNPFLLLVVVRLTLFRVTYQHIACVSSARYVLSV